MKVLFSGRFDPPMVSHVCTIKRLLKEYGQVEVVLLKYPERRWPSSYCWQIFKEIFEGQAVSIKINDTHFAEITEDELNKFTFDIYASGNHKVLKHIEKFNIPVLYVERAYDYHASMYPDPE